MSTGQGWYSLDADPLADIQEFMESRARQNQKPWNYLCQACLERRCPVHLGIPEPLPLLVVHWAGCSDPECDGCLPPAWAEMQEVAAWEQEA